jgi:hypothetical protein
MNCGSEDCTGSFTFDNNFLGFSGWGSESSQDEPSVVVCGDAWKQFRIPNESLISLNI